MYTIYTTCTYEQLLLWPKFNMFWFCCLPGQTIWDSFADMATKAHSWLFSISKFVLIFKCIIFHVCTNLWGLKVGAPPVADAVVNHPVLFNAILPSKDLTSKQMMMCLYIYSHRNKRKLRPWVVLPQSSGVSDLPLHPPLDSALLQACKEAQCHPPHSSSLKSAGKL